MSSGLCFFLLYHMNEDYPGFIAITECDSLLWWKPWKSRYDCKLGNALPLTTSDKSFWWIIQIYKFWKFCVMFCMCKHISKWENSWWIKCFVLVLWIISSCSSTSWLSQSFFHEFPFRASAERMWAGVPFHRIFHNSSALHSRLSVSQCEFL